MYRSDINYLERCKFSPKFAKYLHFRGIKIVNFFDTHCIYCFKLKNNEKNKSRHTKIYFAGPQPFQFNAILMQYFYI